MPPEKTCSQCYNSTSIRIFIHQWRKTEKQWHTNSYYLHSRLPSATPPIHGVSPAMCSVKCSWPLTSWCLTSQVCDQCSVACSGLLTAWCLTSHVCDHSGVFLTSNHMGSHQPGVWPVLVDCSKPLISWCFTSQYATSVQWSVPNLLHGVSPARYMPSVQWGVPGRISEECSWPHIFSGVFLTSYLMVCNQPGMWPECTVERSQPLISPCLLNQVCDQCSVECFWSCDVSPTRCVTRAFSGVFPTSYRVTSHQACVRLECSVKWYRVFLTMYFIRSHSPLGVWPRRLVE